MVRHSTHEIGIFLLLLPLPHHDFRGIFWFTAFAQYLRLANCQAAEIVFNSKTGRKWPTKDEVWFDRENAQSAEHFASSDGFPPVILKCSVIPNVCFAPEMSNVFSIPKASFSPLTTVEQLLVVRRFNQFNAFLFSFFWYTWIFQRQQERRALAVRLLYTAKWLKKNTL